MIGMRKNNRRCSFLLLALLLFLEVFLVGCGSSISSRPQSLVFNESNLTMTIGESIALEYSVSPENAPISNIKFHSSNPNVVRIDGIVAAALSQGEAVITALYDNNNIGQCVIKVGHIEPERIWLNEDVLEGQIGRIINIDIISYPTIITDSLYTITVEDDTIAEYKDGELWGLSTGETNATIMHNATGLSIDCIVRVMPVEEESVSIKCKDSILVGENMPINVEFFPEDTTNQNVTWEISDKSVASLYEGVFYALQPGDVTITVTSALGVTDEKVIKVSPILPKTLSLKCSDEDRMLIIDEKATINASIEPENATDKTVTWSSSDDSIASVSSKGVVKAKKPGKVTIKAETVNGISKTITFTINPRPVSVSNGFIKKPKVDRIAPVEIHASKTESCYVYFKNTIDSKKDFSVFVKAGSTVNVKAPLGSYKVYYASGETWYGTKYKFGVGTSYFKADDTFNFYKSDNIVYGTELTLYKVQGGNLGTIEINEGDFPG